ncbi:PilZ domain-containing protein [bacterium]|nr:PilZ domain-containing protein [bacterium]
MAKICLSLALPQVRIPVLNTENYLELNEQIIWHLQKEEDYNIGIQFISNDEKMKACLSRFIKSIRESE